MDQLWSVARHKVVALVAGAALVLVPTLFSVFPEWTSWPDAVRIAVVVGWFVCAWVVVQSTVRQSNQIDDLLGSARRLRDAARSSAQAELLGAILNSSYTDIPDGHELRLFLPDDDGMLLAEFESPGSDGSHGWQPGQGATGNAWESESLVIATGPAVHDDTHNLTAAQQQRYAHLVAVAAMPVMNAHLRPIAVLTASSATDPDYLASAAAAERLQELAAVTARVLIDVGQVATD